jgi:hypothetical protein
MQGLVTALGGEVGEWSLVKESFKKVFPSMHTSSSILSKSSGVAIDFNADDGKWETLLFKIQMPLQF